MAHIDSIDMAETGHCALCGRIAKLTFHHLIPRTLHSNKWFKKQFTREQMNKGIDVCRECHSAVHRIADHKELGRSLNTREALLAHPEVAKFVEWVKKKRVRHAGRGG